MNSFTSTTVFSQDRPNVNLFIDAFCTADECKSETETSEKWNILKTMPTEQIWTSFSSVSTFLGPIPFDGVFYQEDAWEKYKRGDLDNSVTYILGVNSFEGKSFVEQEYRKYV